VVCRVERTIAISSIRYAAYLINSQEIKIKFVDFIQEQSSPGNPQQPDENALSHIAFNHRTKISKRKAKDMIIRIKYRIYFEIKLSSTLT
jgi:hypothetical protein